MIQLSAEKTVRVYRRATIVDGTGRDRFCADIAVEGARIVAVLPADRRTPRLELPPEAVEVDAHGLVLAPGFIDLAPDANGAPTSGVTTEIVVGSARHAEPDAGRTVNAAVLVALDELHVQAHGDTASMAAVLGADLDAGAFGAWEGERLSGTEAEAASPLRAIVAERGGAWVARSEGWRTDGLGADGPGPDELELEELVRRRAAMPAQRLGLDRGDAPRGVIRAGATADLVVFDPALLTDDPEASGAILEVLVAGVPVVADGSATGAMPGRLLRKPPAPHRATVPHIEATIDSVAAPFRWTEATPILASEDLAGCVDWLRTAPGAVAAGSTDSDPAPPEGAIRLVVDPQLGSAADAAGRVAAEAFRIEVTSAGVEIRGADAVGVFRGCSTLRQLRTPGASTSSIPSGVWQGAPAFGWRGVMLDVARHFRPADDIRRLIDLMADHHLNVLHLHLTDDQGWRFEVPGYPRLASVGARREATQRGHGPLATVEPGVHEGCYTNAELRDLVAYAASRHVTLVPEVELPGHVQAALAAYPELGNVDVGGPVSGPWERFGVNRRTLAPTEEALAFGRAAIDALCDLFDSEWIGIGGDEVPVAEWEQSAAARDRMAALGMSDAHDVQPWFTAHFVAHVRSRGRTALAWDEVLEGVVPDGVRILAWRGPVAMREALRRGIPVVACPDLEAYLDYPQSESAEEPIRVGPPLSIRRAYTLRVEDRAEGGQANVWTEHLPTRDRVDFAMFPRLAAIAERLWQGGDPPPFEDFERRLPTHLRRLAAAGVRYRPLDGPMPEQRRPGVPGKPLTIAEREQIVAGLVARLQERADVATEVAAP